MPNHISNVLIASNKVYDFIKSDSDEKHLFDFNKVIPMPKGLKANPHSGISTWVEIVTGKYNFKEIIRQSMQNKTFGKVWVEKGFDNMINYMGGSTALETLFGDRNNKKGVLDFSDEDFEIFIQCLKNIRKYGVTSWYEWSMQNWGTKWNSYGNEKHGNELYYETAWSTPKSVLVTLSELFPKETIVNKYADEDIGSNAGILTIKNGKVDFERKEDTEAAKLFFELNKRDPKEYGYDPITFKYVEEEE